MSESVSAPPVKTKPVLLLVEDDVAVSLAIRQLLHDENIRCVQAHCMAEAIQQLQDVDFLELTFDGVLADVNLPDGTGCRVVQLFREATPTLPAAIMTGGADLDLSFWLERHGVPLLIKPFVKNELRQWLAQFKRTFEESQARQSA
jgi:CheY-like chemotaxis protein